MPGLFLVVFVCPQICKPILNTKVTYHSSSSSLKPSTQAPIGRCCLFTLQHRVLLQRSFGSIKAYMHKDQPLLVNWILQIGPWFQPWYKPHLQSMSQNQSRQVDMVHLPENEIRTIKILSSKPVTCLNGPSTS